jgi:hypothetical protein
MTAASPASLRAARKRAQYRRMVAATAAAREARREQREELLIVGRPAWEWGVGLLPVDYGIAELVRRAVEPAP